VDTIDEVVSSIDGWVLISKGDLNEIMHVYNLSKDVNVLYRLGADSTSKGIPLEYNKNIVVDSDVYVKVISKYGDLPTTARITKIVIPA